MWNNPALLDRITRLILLATLLFVALFFARLGLAEWGRIGRVEIHGANQPQTLRAVPQVIGRLSGDFFSLDVNLVRSEFQALPWVRQVEVKRLWPGRLRVILEEHVPAAAWNDMAVMDRYGEVYPARPWPGLPKVYAPEGAEVEVARRFGQFAALLKGTPWHIERIEINRRDSWQLGLNDGLVLILGREQLAERLERFARFYPQALALAPSGHGPAAFKRVDLRYPNGFAVRVTT